MDGSPNRGLREELSCLAVWNLGAQKPKLTIIVQQIFTLVRPSKIFEKDLLAAQNTFMSQEEAFWQNDLVFFIFGNISYRS